jgi:hypothetical protein
MGKLHPPSAVLALLCLSGVGAIADDDRVPITIVNDNTDDVIVTLRDMNTNPRSRLLSHQRLNGFASIPISVSPDADGNGHVYWSAVTADPALHRCGHRDRPGLANDASVHVYAKSECSH